MKEISMIAYLDLVNNNQKYHNGVLIAKFNKNYLIGPKVNKKFDKESFIKRIKSSCIYDLKKYKKINTKYSKKLIEEYYKVLGDNEVIEISNKSFTRYKILKVPGDNYVEK